MGFKKISVSNATFSQAVVVAILTSSGFFSWNSLLYAQLVEQEMYPSIQTSLSPFTNSKTQQASICSFWPYIKKSSPKEESYSKHIEEQEVYTSKDEDVFLVSSFFVYKDGDVTISESYEKLLPKTYQIVDLEQGLETFPKTAANLLFSDIHTSSSLHFMGEGNESGIAFFGTKLTNHSAMHSDAQIICEQMRAGVFFDGLSSYENHGGALSGQSIVLKDNQQASFIRCSTHAASDNDVVEQMPTWNGGAIYAFRTTHDHDKELYDHSLSSLNGYVFINKNTNVKFKENSASYGSGGAIACQRFLCLDNSEVEFHKNQALCGGAIASNTGIIFHGNTNKIEFIENKSLASSQDGSSPSGGGALFSKQDVCFQKNSELLCENNSSETCGGAIYAGSVLFSKNNGEHTFKNNQAKEKGGAIYASSFTIIDNSGDHAFVENYSKVGGAVYCHHDFTKDSSGLLSKDGSIEIKQNMGTVAFSNNFANGPSQDYFGGGALWGKNVSICNNMGTVAFYSNTSNSSNEPSSFIGGGAILATDKVCISDNSGIVNITHNSHELSNTFTLEVEKGLGSMRGGGAILSEEIEINGNLHAVSLSRNMVNFRKATSATHDCVLGGGALLGTKRVHIQGNQCFLLQDNVALGNNVSGGAILSDQVDMVGNTVLDCSRNMAQLFGGAICSLVNNLSISDNQGNVLFSGNKTTTAGGALASAKQEVILSKNTGNLEFKENFASGDTVAILEEGQVDITGLHSGGGAIFAKKGVHIVQNAHVTFSGNTAGCFGGAILTGSLDSTHEDEEFASQVVCDGSFVEITDNAGDIVFANNGTKASQHSEHHLFGGGAIYTQNLTIARNQGKVLFQDNYAHTGGAIHITDHGKLLLSAASGDIIFQGNKNLQGESSGIYFSGSHSRIDSLSALKGSCVQFHDALIFEDLMLRKDEKDQLCILEINGEPSDDYVGEIRFTSSASQIPQCVHLRKGTLALTDGAQLCVAGLKQHVGGHILLSAGTSLRVGDFKQEKQSAYADIYSLDIDLSSFTSIDGEALPAPQLVLPEGVDINERGLDITLVDLLGCGYENHDLLNRNQSFTFVSLYSFEKDADPVKVALDPKKIHIHTPEITDQTYGHIGEWSPAQIVDGSVILSWESKGYRLNPEKVGTIVPNSLWATSYDLRLAKEQQLNHQQTMQRMDFDYSMNVCMSGLGTMVDCATKNNLDGFTQRTAGIGIALDAHLLDDLLFGAGFYQMYGDLKSKEFTSVNTRQSFIGSSYAVLSSNSWLFKLGGAFSLTQNRLDTNYRVLGASQGEWEMRGALWNLQADYRYIVNPHKPLSNVISAVVPFAEVEFVRVESQGFLETGSEVRQFDKGSLKNLSLPCGIALEHCYAKGQRSEVNSLSVTYAIDVYRSLSDIQVILPQISLPWSAPGIDLAHQTLKVQFSSNSEWNSYFSTFLSGSYAFREHAKEYNVHTGLRLIF